MGGWLVPPPSEPVKDADELRRERERKVEELARRGLLRSERIRRALLEVPREQFVPEGYRDHTYEEVPLPLPGERATISCPHSYPLFYEPLGLDRGHRLLEIGTGSGYGAAVARLVVGERGLVVSVEVDPETFAYARDNLRRVGLDDVVLVLGDGGEGHPEHAPYDRIAVTAAAPDIPPPLVEQLATGGRLIAPLTGAGRQRLTLVTKRDDGLERTTLDDVLYVDLRGTYGRG